MKYLIIALSLFLSGCAFDSPFVRKEIVVEKQYVIRTATDQQKALPPFPASIDVKTSNQLQLAQWIVDNEKRQLELESIIKRLIEYYEAPVKEEAKK